MADVRCGNHALHDHPLYFICPDLLDAVRETSYGDTGGSNLQLYRLIGSDKFWIEYTTQRRNLG
jgi:hypothetical protein